MKFFPQPIAWSSPRAVTAIMVLALLAVLPIIATAVDASYYVSLTTRILIYALAAIGLNLILGFGGMVSLGHAMYVLLGAYAVAIPASHGITSVKVSRVQDPSRRRGPFQATCGACRHADLSFCGGTSALRAALWA